MRVSDTICVQEQVPSGAAAVLINRTHTYKDLVLVIGPAEKKLFDAIAGQQTIDEILDGTLSATDPVMRIGLAGTFFEQLWWHDQVVFETRMQARNLTLGSVLSDSTLGSAGTELPESFK